MRKFLPFIGALLVLGVAIAASPPQGGSVTRYGTITGTAAKTDTFVVPSSGVYRSTVALRITALDTYTVDTVKARNLKFSVVCARAGSKRLTASTDTLQAQDSVGYQKATVNACYVASGDTILYQVLFASIAGTPGYSAAYRVEHLR